MTNLAARSVSSAEPIGLVAFDGFGWRSLKRTDAEILQLVHDAGSLTSIIHRELAVISAPASSYLLWCGL